MNQPKRSWRRRFKRVVLGLLLSEMLGPVLLPADRRIRVHRLRQVARQAFGRLSDEDRRFLEAYAEGVNAGEDHSGRLRAVAWMGHRPEAVNLRLRDLEVARGVDEGVLIANRSGVPTQHPLSRILPLAGRWLDMPAQPLSGDVFVPRVHFQASGASERLVVSPGNESEGIFHMPGGQSGHPFSPHYRDAHSAWVEGKPTPFLPGEPVHVLRLVPRG